MLGKVYTVLSDKEQKTIYDEQGIVDEESDPLSQDRCWDEYWRVLFPKVLGYVGVLVNNVTHYMYTIHHFLLTRNESLVFHYQQQLSCYCINKTQCKHSYIIECVVFFCGVS